MQLIVLGMHRSGTSVLARILNLMGLYLGPEGISTGANSENPKGFWERRDVRLLNDAILHSVGCDWDRVAGLDLDKVPKDIQQAFDKVAGRLLLEMDAHRPWFIKEPRLCMLLPLWLRHMEAPVIVNVYRDPVEVAASLHRRNGMPMEAGLELWEYYVRSAAAASESLPAVSVLHSQLMMDPVAVASRLHEELVLLGVQGIRHPTARELASFVDRGLHRERSGRDDLVRYRDCRQVGMYRHLVEQRGGPLTDAWPAEGWQALRAYEQDLGPVPVPDSRKVRASGYDVFKLSERIKANDLRIDRIKADILAKLEERIGELSGEVRTAHIKESENAVELLERERARVDRLQAELSELTASRSWRMTSPLRAISRRLRGRLGR